MIYNALKNKIQKSKKHNSTDKLEDLVGFVQQFMNWAASHLAHRKELWRTVEKERFFKGRNWVWKKEVY